MKANADLHSVAVKCLGACCERLQLTFQSGQNYHHCNKQQFNISRTILLLSELNKYFYPYVSKALKTNPTTIRNPMLLKGMIVFTYVGCMGTSSLFLTLGGAELKEIRLTPASE